jgi:predicted enzyme related to lactoylglutathione lyase
MGPTMAMGVPGRPGWHELLTTDGDAAFGFYAGLFGWRKDTGHDMGPMGVYQLFNAGGDAIGGMMTKPASIPGPPFWTYYFNVAGIEPAIGRIEAGGGKIINGPMEVPGGAWIVQALDPQGVMFALVGSRT